jgi:hypothetical protein
MRFDAGIAGKTVPTHPAQHGRRPEMSAPQNSGNDLQDAFVAFSQEVFEATQRLLSAQQQLTQDIVEAASRTGAGETEQDAEGEIPDDDEAGAEDSADEDVADEDVADEDVADEDVADEDVADEDVADEDQGGENADEDEDVASGGLDADESADTEDTTMVTGTGGRSGRGRRR